jgi:hypothetical protein
MQLKCMRVSRQVQQLNDVQAKCQAEQSVAVKFASPKTLGIMGYIPVL